MKMNTLLGFFTSSLVVITKYKSNNGILHSVDRFQAREEGFFTFDLISLDKSKASPKTEKIET